ncbi:MAG TPA: TlpA disulfide reductase family protein [Gemmatimonadaceae bacterium]|nr:TlpA disulfide reductase family protein [Gemmatimonadaceae bacterium]
MTHRQQWGIVAGIVLFLAGVLAAGVHFLGDELFPVTVGSKAPPIVGVTLDGKSTPKQLADYSGKVVLLNVWATWCEPCRVEMPSIEKLHRELGPQGLAVVAISVDDPGAEQRIRDYVKELGLTFEILHDPQQGTTRNYQITGYPETFIIARDGTIRRKMIGPDDWSSTGNRALVRELLGLAPGTAPDPGIAEPGRDTPDSVTLKGAATPAN